MIMLRFRAWGDSVPLKGIQVPFRLISGKFRVDMTWKGFLNPSKGHSNRSYCKFGLIRVPTHLGRLGNYLLKVATVLLMIEKSCMTLYTYNTVS